MIEIILFSVTIFIMFIACWADNKIRVKKIKENRKHMQLKIYGGICDYPNTEHCTKHNRALDKMDGSGCESCPGWTPGEV